MAESKRPGDSTSVSRSEWAGITLDAKRLMPKATGWVFVSLHGKKGGTILGSFGVGEDVNVNVLSTHPGKVIEFLKTGIEVMERDAAEREHQRAVSDVKAAHYVEVRGDETATPDAP